MDGKEFVKQTLDQIPQTSANANVKNRLQKGIEKYEQYRHCYDTYMQSDEARKKIAEFDTLFPKTDITDVKKFMLWQER